MKYYAKLDDNNTVVTVIVIPEDQDYRGPEFIKEDLNLDGRWLKTCENTFANETVDGSVPFRKNFAGVGYYYDEDMDAFIPPKMYDSWHLNVEKGIWEAPIPMPNDTTILGWDDLEQTWITYPSNTETGL